MTHSGDAHLELTKCIFCLESKPKSVEHVFPETIGGTLLIESVCADCNSWLGTNVDAALVDHPLILMARAQLRLPKKDGGLPDVIKKVFNIGSLRDDPNQQVLTLTDPETKQLSIKMLYKRTATPHESGGEAVSIIIDKSDESRIGTIIQRERRRAGLTSLTDDELALEVEGIVANNHGTIDKPTVRYSIPIDLIQYQRGLLKICYELAWRWLGDEFLSDPNAAKIRQCILCGIPTTPAEIAKTGLRGNFTIGANIDPFQLWNKEPNSNIGLAMRVGKKISVGVRIFSTMAGVVCVSENASAYQSFGEKEGQFIAIDPTSGERRETTLAEETSRIIRAGTSIFP